MSPHTPPLCRRVPPVCVSACIRVTPCLPPLSIGVQTLHHQAGGTPEAHHHLPVTVRWPPHTHTQTQGCEPTTCTCYSLAMYVCMYVCVFSMHCRKPSSRSEVLALKVTHCTCSVAYFAAACLPDPLQHSSSPIFWPSSLLLSFLFLPLSPFPSLSLHIY